MLNKNPEIYGTKVDPSVGKNPNNPEPYKCNSRELT
jgi:hypothetical protein